jgi:hypothetical protein
MVCNLLNLLLYLGLRQAPARLLGLGRGRVILYCERSEHFSPKGWGAVGGLDKYIKTIVYFLAGRACEPQNRCFWGL